jgi:hypothetical protein
LFPVLQAFRICCFQHCTHSDFGCSHNCMHLEPTIFDTAFGIGCFLQGCTTNTIQALKPRKSIIWHKLFMQLYHKHYLLLAYSLHLIKLSHTTDRWFGSCLGSCNVSFTRLWASKN